MADYLINRQDAMDAVNYHCESLKDIKRAIMALPSADQWIPVSERLPEEDEYDGNVCKYYLVQDEYGDMHVAHMSHVGWIPMYQLEPLECEVAAWQPLPKPWKGGKEK